MTHSIVGEGLDPPAVLQPACHPERAAERSGFSNFYDCRGQSYINLGGSPESKDPYSPGAENGFFGYTACGGSAQNDSVLLRLTPTGGLKTRPYSILCHCETTGRGDSPDIWNTPLQNANKKPWQGPSRHGFISFVFPKWPRKGR